MTRARRPQIARSAVATGRGDDGTTGLLFGGERVAKDDLRTEAYGTVDEAVAALGVARAELRMRERFGVLPQGLQGYEALLLRLQRELFVVGAELATNPEAWHRLVEGQTKVSEAMLDGLEATLRDLEGHVTISREFVVPGETRLSAALEVARTTVRRAERRVVPVLRAELLAGPWLLPYVNRLADLLWVLARAAEQAEAQPSTPARPIGRPAPAPGAAEDAAPVPRATRPAPDAAPVPHAARPPGATRPPRV